MEVSYIPTKRLKVLGMDRRSVENLAWCAATYGVNRLFWIDGYLLCAEVYERSFEREIESGEFTITHVCYAKFPKYYRIFEVDKGTHIPIVNVSDMKMFNSLLQLIKEDIEKSNCEETEPDSSSTNTFKSYRKYNNSMSV